MNEYLLISLPIGHTYTVVIPYKRLRHHICIYTLLPSTDLRLIKRIQKPSRQLHHNTLIRQAPRNSIKRGTIPPSLPLLASIHAPLTLLLALRLHNGLKIAH